MESDNTEDGPSQESGLIVQQDGKPQRVLAKFLNLMLNYQYGLGVVMAQDLARATSLMQKSRDAIRCTFLIRNQEISDKAVLAELGKDGLSPLFLILPQVRLETQRTICGDQQNVYYCAWETAFAHTESAVQEVAREGLDKHGIGDLLRDIDRIPYPVVQQQVEKRLRSINTLPTLPEIVMRIMRMVNDPKTTSDEMERVLLTDPSIIMKLLQVVRSPVFAGTVQRGSFSLKEIIVRLGLKKVGAIAQQIKLINSLVRPEDSGFDLRRFWEHSVGTAIIADKLYTDRLLPLKGEVEFTQYWVGSLLHDVGKLVLGFFFWEWFSRVLDRVESIGTNFRRAEASLGDSANHERLGQLMLLNSNMGPELANAVGTHHTIGDAPDDLQCLIHIANNLCKDLGLGYLDGEKGQYNKDVLDALGLEQSNIDLIIAALAEELVGEIKNMVEQCL